MNLIYYRGLNCHLACLINIACMLGADYLDAFATLWSETDFTDETEYNIYVSRRVFVNLESIGIIIKTPDCEETKAAETLSRIPNGEMFLVGIDTYYLPWHPVFKNFHAPHYIFIQKETGDSFLCFDPVYNENKARMTTNDVLSASFIFSHVYRADTIPPKNGIVQEAKAVTLCHPEITEKLQAEILKCKSEGRKNIALLIKQINAMINNRYLFSRFFTKAAPVSKCYESFFDDSYFLKWEAVRNGLYKASVIKDNDLIISKVCRLFADLMHEEITMAKKILSASCP